MQRYFQRIYGAKPSPEIIKSRPQRRPKRRTVFFVNRLYEDSTKSPSIIFEDTFRRERRNSLERAPPPSSRLSSLSDSHRSSALSRKIDDFLNSVVIKEKEKSDVLRGSTRSLSSSNRSKRSVSSHRRMDYPLPDLSKVKSTLLNSKHYQGPRGRHPRRSASSERLHHVSTSSSHHQNPLRINHVQHSTDNESSQDSAYAGESSRQHTPTRTHHRHRRRPSMVFMRVTKLWGAYSPKSLNKILESRLAQYQKETSRREALEMMAKLKKDLGITSNKGPPTPPGPPICIQKDSGSCRERLSSAGSSCRRKRRPGLSCPSSNSGAPLNQLYRSRSCDDVLDIYSDKELFNLLKKDAGLDKKFANDVIRVVRGRSEENLPSLSRRRKSKDDRNFLKEGLQKENNEEEQDLYNDDEFEKSESKSGSSEEDPEEVKEEIEFSDDGSNG
ncbi:unnamed protein product [Lepeophtheirus salmonis]|uniref:(salmon louse) hypothetical protein n=1 Tax=Lepeophtheirus salmonis TaxID=72036 RepID=A0A7R8D4F6_LEPSM|nr:unnamed protein product [Lepeophtheirus salmonis]CAF3025763.1 unnamed protein product [Lepeophtheirus salmonis]